MNNQYLVHHGIQGQRWGVRRYQNEDGSLTRAGRRKYDVNADGTTNIKDRYRKNSNTKGYVKTAVGTAIIAKNIGSVIAAKNKHADFSSNSGKKMLNKVILGTLIGSVIIASGAKNFVDSNKNRSFNTTGMGGTPEKFSGKPKTRNQVLAAQKKLDKK